MVVRINHAVSASLTDLDERSLLPDAAEVIAADRQQCYYGWRVISESLRPLDDEYDREYPDVFSRLCPFIDAHAGELEEHRVST